MPDRPKPIKHSEEWWEVNNAIAEENGAFKEDKNPCHEVKHSPGGVCPCCGAELIEENHVTWAGDEIGELDYMQQTCWSCGWQSIPLYDV